MAFDDAFARRTVLAGFGAAAGLAAFGRPAQAADSYRIGALNTITGAAGAFGTGVQKTIIESCKRINALGGAGGRMLEVFAEDSQTLPEPALLAARKLIEVNKVQALLGVYSSPEALAIIPVTNAADVILMHTGAAPKLATENTKGLSFQFYPNSTAVGSMLFQVTTREGFKTPITLTLTNDASIGNTAAFAARWKAKTGTAPADVQYQPGQPNYRSELQKALSLNPDLIIVNGYEPDATIIVKQLYELGNNATLLLPEFAATPRLIAAVGKGVAEGILVYRFVPNQNSPAYKAFDALYQSVMNAPGQSNTYGAIAFDQVNLVALALEANPHAVTGTDVAAAIHTICGPEGEVVNSFAEGQALLKKGVKILNYEGASGPCDFDKLGQTPANFGLSTIKNGEYVFKYDVEFKR